MKAKSNHTDNSIKFLFYEFNYKTGSIIDENGKEMFLEPRLKEVFYALLKSKNEFISKDKLMNSAWKGIIVSDHSVTKAISDLRRFLSENHFNDLKIITISKLGYKLEIIEKVEKPIYNRVLKIGLYTLGIIIGLVIIIRALRYEQ